MCDAQDLIMAVEKHPCLWDINDKDYHNRDVKDLAWEQVCKEVIRDWETCTDKTNKCAELKKKWTNIRDYYRKEIQQTKHTPSGSAAKNKKKYIYGELLYFLTPMFAKRNSEGNYQDENSESANSQPQLQNEEETIQQEENINNLEQSAPIPTTPSTPTTPTPPVNKKKKKDIPGQILNILQQRQKTTTMSSNVNEDDDTKFLLSFRSYMKKMTSDEKIEFQLDMLELVKKINTGSRSSSSLSPLQFSDSNSLPSPLYSPYTSVQQSSPIYYNVSSPPATFMPSQQQNASGANNSKVSPIYYNVSSPPATFIPSQQQNASGASTSKVSPIYYNVSSPPSTFIPSQQQNASGASTSKVSPKYHNVSSPPSTFISSQKPKVSGTNSSNVLIHSVTDIESVQSSSLQNPIQVQYRLQNNSDHDYSTPAEDDEAAQAVLILQSQNPEGHSITQYLKFK